MANHLNLPTSVEEFVQFLEGTSVFPYGDNGVAVIDVLRKRIQVEFYNAFCDTLGQRKPGIRMDIFRFLRTKVFRYVMASLPSARTSELGHLDGEDEIWTACYDWVVSFSTTHLVLPSENTPNLVSESKSLTLIKELFEACDKGEAPIQINDSRIDKISHQLLWCMRRHLADLEDDERLARKAADSLKFTSIGGMDMQEALDAGLFHTEDWQNAWNQPYRGRPLHALENKLQLNAHAIRNDVKKAQMSRIIPVVQASGTGKSRLSEEYSALLTFV